MFVPAFVTCYYTQSKAFRDVVLKNALKKRREHQKRKKIEKHKGKRWFRANLKKKWKKAEGKKELSPPEIGGIHWEIHLLCTRVIYDRTPRRRGTRMKIIRKKMVFSGKRHKYISDGRLTFTSLYVSLSFFLPPFVLFSNRAFSRAANLFGECRFIASSTFSHLTFPSSVVLNLEFFNAKILNKLLLL